MRIFKATRLLFNNLKRASLINDVRKCSSKVNIALDNISLNKYLSSLEVEYNTLRQTEGTKHKRVTQLEPVIKILNQRTEILENLDNLKVLMADKDREIQNLAIEENALFEKKLDLVDDTIREVVLSIEGDDDLVNDMVLEINAGVGGQEAMLFASELFEMYMNFTNFKGWTYEVAEYLKTEIGGIRHASVLIYGKKSFHYFKHEAGVHRVQRIPSTEKSGRIHTSTVSVLCLPQPTDIQVDLQTKDLRIETKRATGAGGQHVNTTDSAVRIVHLPTGLAVECQTDRSQIKNREIALQRLRAKLYDIQVEEQNVKLEATKKSQVKSNFRNEKIRTYNYNQDRISDHRLSSGSIHNLKGFMAGGEALQDLIKKLDRWDKLNRLKVLIEQNE